MAASDDLKKLSERAKVAEDRATAAVAQGRSDLERTVSDVRESADAEAKKFQARTKAAGQQASDSWAGVQQSWDAHIAKARADVAERKAEFDASTAADRADAADFDAELAIDYAYGAIEEAEYAVLDAILARREAEEAEAVVARR
jgi:hypothetical protein